MSCNNFLASYSSYFGYPGTWNNNKNCYGSRKSCCDPCKPKCCNKIKCCNPCQPICSTCTSFPQCNNICQPQCNNICQPQCNNICQPQCNPCVITCPPCPAPCPTTSFITGIPTPTTLVTGSPTTIIVFGVPTTNIGGIVLNPINGQFTVPTAGRYVISGYIGFSANPTGTREVSIFRIDATTNITSLLASDTRNATSIGPTNVTVTTTADLNAGDRIYFVATQNSGATLSTTTDSRISIVRLC